jgi:hypothetical protein
MDEDTYKTAVSSRVESGQKGVKVPLLWEKPLKKESYNRAWAEHAEDALAAKPLAEKFKTSEDVDKETAPSPETFVQHQKGNLHASKGEFKEAREKIAGVVFKAARASSASKVVVRELLAQLLESELVSEDLREVTASTVVAFLKKLIAGDDYHGIDRKRFDELWEREPDRKHIKKAFRDALQGGGQHEWIPTSEIPKILDLSDEKGQEHAVRWLELMHHLRTPTDQVVFLRTFEFELEDFKQALKASGERPLIDKTLNTRMAGQKEPTSMDELGRHVTHEAAQAVFPTLETHRQPLHDVLRGIFEETKTGDPADFVNALLRNLAKILWVPGENVPDGMQKLAEKQRDALARVISSIEEGAENAGI